MMARKTQARSTTSRFATVLQQLLDETAFYDRRGWSQFLGVSQPALSQWVNDRTVPRADLMRMVVDLLRSRGGEAAEGALAALDAIMDEPTSDISPLGSRFAPDLRTYLSVRSLGDIGRSLRDLPPDEQIALLRQGEMGILRHGSIESEAAIAAAMKPSADRLPVAQGLGPVWRSPRLVKPTSAHGFVAATSKDLSETRLVVLVGPAGSGKTTYLNNLRATVLEWREAEAIKLREWSVEALGNWFAARMHVEKSVRFVLDGLDEVPMPDRLRTIKLINGAVSAAPAIRLLVGSRPIGELAHLQDFETYAIAPLSDVDLVAEVTRSSLATRSPLEADRFLCHLTERESLKTALRNPLFLNAAWSLFENSALTPFAEGAIVRECTRVLLERDHWKGFSRMRQPWASSHSLFTLLGEVSLNLLRHKVDTFDETSLRSMMGRSPWKVPVDQFLDLLVTLGVLRTYDHSYAFSHRLLLDYFAASYVVESTAAADEYFRSVTKLSELSGAWRLASSLASDATHLLKTVISNTGSASARVSLLAEMLAQPIAAEQGVLEESTRAVVSWLDDATSDWKVIETGDDPDDEPAQWLLCADTAGSKDVETIAGPLRAIHRARSGPANPLLREQLSMARPGFLREFGEAMEIEGKLSVNFGSAGASHRSARVAVECLQLA